MPKPLFITLLVGLPVLFSIFGQPGLAFAALVLVLIANPIVRVIRKNRYFASDEFQQLKRDISSVVAEHNEVANYVEEIRATGSFELGASASGQHAHLATFTNTSNWNYNRSRNTAEYAPHVHNASLQVVRNASMDPLKYVMKYFNIKADQSTLADVQRLSEDISRLEEAAQNVKDRETDIQQRINPPEFITKHYADEFWKQVGVHLAPVEVPYPQYKIQYTSAGGNSAQETAVRFDSPTLEALASVMVDKIRWTKSAAGQRALMTRRLRTEIKERDSYTCLNCGISVMAEPHLLLEIDHIIPVSRGGLSTHENLQTLCWKCNRSKGSKILS